MPKQAKADLDDSDADERPADCHTPEEVVERERTERCADVTEQWWYRDRYGEGVLLRYRLEADDCNVILQTFCDGEHWVTGWPAKKKVPLYRAYEVGEPPLFIVEGEDAADWAAGMGLSALTSAGGPEDVERSDWQPAAGRRVVILPTNSDDGRRFALAVAASVLRAGTAGTGAHAGVAGVGGRGRHRLVRDGPSAVAGRAGQKVRELAAQRPVMKPADVAGWPVMRTMLKSRRPEVRWLWRGRVPIGKPMVIYGGLGPGKSIIALNLAAKVSAGAEWPVELSGEGTQAPFDGFDQLAAGKPGTAQGAARECDPDEQGPPARHGPPAAGRGRGGPAKDHHAQFGGAHHRGQRGPARHHAARLGRPGAGGPIGRRRAAGGDRPAVGVLRRRAAHATPGPPGDNRSGGLGRPVRARGGDHLRGGRRDGLGYSANMTLMSTVGSAWMLADEPGDRRLLLPIKSVVGQAPGGLACSISQNAMEWEPAPVADDRALGTALQHALIGSALSLPAVSESNPPAVSLSNASNSTAVSVSNAPAVKVPNPPKGRRGPKAVCREVAMQWLARQLADGPIPVGSAEPGAAEPGTLRAAAKSAGLAWTNVHRAFQDLKIVSEKSDTGKYVWHLPAASAAPNLEKPDGP